MFTFHRLSRKRGKAGIKAAIVYTQRLDFRNLVTLALHPLLLRVLSAAIKQLQKPDQYLLDHLKVSKTV